MYRFFKYLIIVFSFICLFRVYLFAEEESNYVNKYVKIILSNGRNMVGKIIKQTEERIILKMLDDKGSVSFDKSRIRQIIVVEKPINVGQEHSGVTPVLENQTRVVADSEVKDVYFNVYKKFGAIEGYVIFRDNQGKQCAANGTYTLSVLTQAKVKKWIAAPGELYSKPTYVPENSFGFSKKVSFNPNDFKLMALRTGDEIYALPIELPSEAANSGDKIVLEVSRFRKEQVL